MAEQRFTNTSVNLKAKRRSQSEVKRNKDNVYDEMDMKNKGTKQTADTNDKRCSCIKCCTSVIPYLAVLFLIMALRVYFTTWLIHKNEDLMRSQLNLTKACTAFETQIRDLTSENQNLTEQLKHMKKELSLCPERPCKTCQEGWLSFESSCYAINDAEEPQQKTWEGAREDCKGKMSNLAVVIKAAEKKYISDKSWKSSGEKGYWIGLRGEGGRWKWVDGSYLTDDSWIQQPPSNGMCVISVQNEGFKSVSCDKKKQWICKKKL